MEKKCLSGDVNVRIGEVKKRVNWSVSIERGPKGIYRVQEDTPKP